MFSRFSRFSHLPYILAIICAVIAQTAKAITAEEIMLLNEKSRKSITEYTDLYMTLTNESGQTRERVLKLRIDDSHPTARKTYVEFVSPKDVKGTKILTLETENPLDDSDRWIYLPALQKIRRIAASDIGESFVGTDFTYEDMEIADGVVGVKNHKYTMLREEEIADSLGVVKKCWVIEAVPVTAKRIKESSYSKRMMWIEQQHYTDIEDRYFNKEGVHFKTRTSADVREFPAQSHTVWRPNKIEMKNLLNQHKTLVTFDQLIDKPIDPKVFTQAFLKIGL